MNLDVLIDDDIDLERLATVLDGTGHIGRLATIRQWGRRTQERLYDAAKGFKPITLDYFVPSDVPPLVEVIHWGKNSLPSFTIFQKRFCKPTADATELWGYNDNHELRYQWAIGPGYFVTHVPDRSEADPGEIDIDYCKLPTGKPSEWPKIKRNEAGISRFIYAGMVDVMRGISSHVSIGRARKGGKWLDAWFVLCREDRTPS